MLAVFVGLFAANKWSQFHSHVILNSTKKLMKSIDCDDDPKWIPDISGPGVTCDDTSDTDMTCTNGNIKCTIVTEVNTETYATSTKVDCSDKKYKCAYSVKASVDMSTGTVTATCDDGGCKGSGSSAKTGLLSHLRHSRQSRSG